ncbi:MAG: formate dehydrogenase subunit gamma [Bryobacteraceae bacterium]
MSTHPGTVNDPAIPPDEMVRYSYSERICHWLSGLSYLYCLISGLALFSPYLYWLAFLLGGGPAARFWHPWAGLVFVVAAIWMHAIWRHDMSMDDIDRRWLKSIKNYVTNRDDLVPPQGRFNAGQKQFYWIMFYGAIVLLISGVVMWFPELVPRGANWVRGAAILIHEIAALVTIGAFIIHVYMGVFMVPGGFRGIVSGHVSRHWARSHHPLWYSRVTGDPNARR